MIIIEELWIINENGIPLHNQKIEDTIDSALFSGFLSAITNFAKEIGENSMDMIKLGDSVFIILKEKKKNSLLFVGKSKDKVKDEKVRKLLFKIRDKFIEFFDKELVEWDGNRTEYFESFVKVFNLKNDMDNIVQKFKQVNW